MCAPNDLTKTNGGDQRSEVYEVLAHSECEFLDK